MSEEDFNEDDDAASQTMGAEDAGTRLDAFLATRLEVSRARAQKIGETATVNGKSAKSSHTLREGDSVVWQALPEANNQDKTARLALVPHDFQLDILFEDEHLLVLNKPSGISVHPGAGAPAATMVDILRAHNIPLSSVGPNERAGIVHRLDKETSGVLLVAKTDAAHWKLAAAFESRDIEKTYFALCCGVPPARGRIEAPIARHHTHRKRMAVLPEGRHAVTEYKITQSWEKFAALEVNLLTGRTHQIRVHLAYIQHPLVGDGVYGGLARALDSTPNLRARMAMEKIKGQALHASKIGFVHPISGEKMEFSAPLPEEIGTVVKALDEGN